MKQEKDNLESILVTWVFVACMVVVAVLFVIGITALR